MDRAWNGWWKALGFFGDACYKLVYVSDGVMLQELHLFLL